MVRTKEMTSGDPLPIILSFSIPLILGNLLQQTYSLIDAAIVGRFLGINSLASVGASGSVIFLILGFCGGCCSGFGIPVAQKFGAKDYLTMRRLVAVSLKLAAIMSVVLAIITSLMCSSILRWMQTPDTIFDDAYRYLLITFISIPATFFYNLLSCIIRALGDSKTPFLFLLISTLLNITLDLLFILVFHWGVAGAAIATLVAQCVSGILCYRYMYRKYEILHTLPNDRKFRPELAKELLLIGTPMGLQFSITAVGSIMMQSANNSLGTACIAAYTAGIRIKMFFLCMVESIGIAMATYCGQNYGAGKPERIWQGVKSAALIMAIYVIIVNLVLWNFSEEFTSLFVDANEHEIIEKTALFLHVSASFFPFLGILCILRYSIQGAGFTRLALFSGVSEMFARILISLVAVPIWGYWAICFGDSFAWICAVAFLIPAFGFVYKKLLRIVEKKEIQA